MFQPFLGSVPSLHFHHKAVKKYPQAFSMFCLHGMKQSGANFLLTWPRLSQARLSQLQQSCCSDSSEFVIKFSFNFGHRWRCAQIHLVICVACWIEHGALAFLCIDATDFMAYETMARKMKQRKCLHLLRNQNCTNKRRKLPQFLAVFLFSQRKVTTANCFWWMTAWLGD